MELNTRVKFSFHYINFIGVTKNWDEDLSLLEAFYGATESSTSSFKLYSLPPRVN